MPGEEFTLPDALVFSLSNRDKSILALFQTRVQVSVNDVHTLLGGTYDSAGMAFSRFRTKMKGFVVEKSRGVYILAPVGEMPDAREYTYAQSVFGKTMTPYEILELFATEEGLASLTSNFVENMHLLQGAIQDFFDLDKPLCDPETREIFTAYREAMHTWQQAYRIFEGAFKTILTETNKPPLKRDFLLLGNRGRLVDVLKENSQSH